MRYNNGHVDNGSRVRGSSSRCPKCKANTYVETVSREYCSSCGLECDYWGKGSNEVYDEYMQDKYNEEAQEEEIRKEREHQEWVDLRNSIRDGSYWRDDEY